ncbi:hypothetical protein HPP92_009380 [Vanilla planifolia]|uniref:Alpha/beta hydrolase fold-3 domain-containing protein n=1 Tax=Vanilla planifolia TaxID=51239 RepID=A0A835R449_VANPL|nr:hypothetical protein HPP92_009380 [Vanilla planifolia]
MERLFHTKSIPACVEPHTGVSYHDVTINPFTCLSARLYLPPTAVISRQKATHRHLNSLGFEADVIAVSVNYRLAPEHPLTEAYDDHWESLLWLTNECPGLDRCREESGDFGY